MKPAEPLLLEDWIDAAATYPPDAWETLPQIDLYMDQVITLMNRHAEVLTAEPDRPLTSSMINNYVKDGVMPRPHQKKYNREHLTALSIIRMLKSEFTLPQIRSLMNGLSQTHSTKEIYASYCDALEQSLHDAASNLEERTADRAALYRLALSLALDANAKRLAAARLLEHLEQTTPKD